MVVLKVCERELIHANQSKFSALVILNTHHLIVSFDNYLTLFNPVFEFNLVEILLLYWNPLAPLIEIVVDLFYIPLHLFNSCIRT